MDVETQQLNCREKKYREKEYLKTPHEFKETNQRATAATSVGSGLDWMMEGPSTETKN